jgi:hypothetical protein
MNAIQTMLAELSCEPGRAGSMYTAAGVRRGTGLHKNHRKVENRHSTLHFDQAEWTICAASTKINCNFI